jgi:hypothetical protein
MKIIILATILTLGFFSSSCPKKDSNTNPQLPPPTQTGANTVGFLLNGKIWLPGGSPFPIPKMNAQYYRGNFSFSTNKKKADSVSQILSWSVFNVYSTGTYYFGPLASFSDLYRIPFNSNISCQYYTNDSDWTNNKLEITRLDSVKRIISGTFKMRFIAPECDTIWITDGRFDAVYTY